MSYEDRLLEEIIKHNDRMKSIILRKYGLKKVEAKQRELCDRCSRKPRCPLLPLNSDGSDCVYADQAGIPIGGGY